MGGRGARSRVLQSPSVAPPPVVPLSVPVKNTIRAESLDSVDKPLKTRVQPILRIGLSDESVETTQSLPKKRRGRKKKSQ
jgi:hypothetical protein